MIENYRFGKMKIDGETYTNDLKIFPDEIKTNWWREQGHFLQVEDIQDIVEWNPDVVIIGQGASSRMKISEEAENKLEENDIEMIAQDTHEAVRLFNQEDREVIGAFHLTC